MRCGSRFQRIYLAHAGKGAADVGNGDGAADDQGDVQSVSHFIALPALFTAANQVIGDAVVATQNGRGDQAHKFLGFRAEGTGLIRLMIESEEPLHAEVAAIENFFVQIGASALKIFKAVCYGSSESGAIIMD
jgi:hypothetical protein